MQKDTFLITSETGLDVKTIATIVNFASSFESPIKFEVEGKEADAKSIINLMALNVKSKQTLKIKTEGLESKKIIDGIVNILKESNCIK